MMAAITAAERGAQVLLLEKNSNLGRKLAITGKGRCNITNAVSEDEFIDGYAHNGRFLHSALHELSNFDLVEFFNCRGLKTKVERGQRVFPTSDKADGVIEVLVQAMRDAKVRVLTSTTVAKLAMAHDQIKGVNSNQGTFDADCVIVATGGLSYPGTGSTGDGYVWAKDCGHKIVDLRPALVPLVAKEAWVKSLQGLSLRNVEAAAYNHEGKKIISDFGELLFTHYGLSGPIILSMSNTIADYIQKSKKKALLVIDLKPALDYEKLDLRLQRVINDNSNKRLYKMVKELLPMSLVPIIIQLAGLNENKVCHQISRLERENLLKLIKQLPVTIVGTRSIAEAIVTAGGINIKDINPKTMQSKLIKGLFFAGEIIDVDGFTGGYNLQAAFSTGFLAGKSAARS